MQSLLSSMSSSRRSGSGGSRANAGVLKERANMSFMLVVMFFAVFGLIVLTEIFLIDERRGVSVGGTGVLGGHRSGHRLPVAPDRPDYGEVGVSITKGELFFLLLFFPKIFNKVKYSISILFFYDYYIYYYWIRKVSCRIILFQEDMYKYLLYMILFIILHLLLSWTMDDLNK